jgi:hypothetical protein
MEQPVAQNYPVSTSEFLVSPRRLASPLSPNWPTISFRFIPPVYHLWEFAHSILSITALTIAAAAVACPFFVALVLSYHLGFRYSTCTPLSFVAYH